MFDRKRREFIALLGGAAAAWPLTARAQQPAMPVVGFQHRGHWGHLLTSFLALRAGLKTEGFEEGRNVVFDTRWVGEPARIGPRPRRQSWSPIALTLSSQPRAIGPRLPKQRRQRYRLSAVFGGDPVKAGFVASLNRPEAPTLTGVSLLTFAWGQNGSIFAARYWSQAQNSSPFWSIRINRTPKPKTDAAGVEAAARCIGTANIDAERSAASAIIEFPPSRP